MSTNFNNSSQPTRLSNRSRILVASKQLVQNKRLTNWMSQHVAFGNVIFLMLLAYSGYNIFKAAVPKGMPTGYEQIQITQDDLDAVCTSKKYYNRKLRSLVLAGKEITPLGAEYRSDKTEVYPVFRWACHYSISDQSLADPDTTGAFDSGSSLSPEYRYTGLSLDEYHCAAKYKTRGLTKAIHLDYSDPYSWVCTNINAQF